MKVDKDKFDVLLGCLISPPQGARGEKGGPGKHRKGVFRVFPQNPTFSRCRFCLPHPRTQPTSNHC